MIEKDMPVMEEMPEVQLPDYQSEIAAIVHSGLAPKPMRDRLLDYHENDIAMAMALLTPEDRRRLYGLLDTPTLAGILEYADSPDVYLDELPLRTRVDLLGKMELPAILDYLGEKDKTERNNLIDLLDDEVRQEVTLALSFDEDEIGSRKCPSSMPSIGFSMRGKAPSGPSRA